MLVLNRADGSIHFKFEKQHLSYEINEGWKWLVDGFEFGLVDHAGLTLYAYDEARARTRSGMAKFEAIRIHKEFYGVISFLVFNKNYF